MNRDCEEKRIGNDKTARLFLLIGGLAGILLVFCIPPFQAPDEPAHFYRAYQVSEGMWLPEVNGIHSGGVIPASLPLIVERITGEVPFHPREKVDIQDILSLFEVPLKPEHRVFMAFPNTAIYSPVPYLAQAAGIAAGRFFRFPTAALVYWGRCFNLFLYLVLVTGAIRVTPVAAWLFFSLGLMPMAIFQGSTLSSDAWTNAIGFLFIAAMLRAYSRDTYLALGELAGISISAVLLMLSKPGYAPLLLLFFLLPRRRLTSTARYWSVLVLVPLGAVVIATAWGWMVRSAVLPLPHVNKQEQIRFIFSHPRRFIAILFAAIRYRTPEYLITFIGRLGWIDVRLSPWFVLSYLLVLSGVSVAGYAEEPKLTAASRILLAAVFLGNVILLLVLLYLWWNPVGHPTIEGLQGRYLIPCAPAAFLPWRIRFLRVRRLGYAGFCLVAYTIFSLGYTVFRVVMRYYVPGVV